MNRLIFALVWLSVAGFTPPARGAETVDLHLNDTVIRAEVARDRKTKARGLGYRDRLAAGRGMLFEFVPPRKYPFHMKGMRFPIDIIWIYRLRVVGVTKSVPPPEKPTDKLPLYYPPVPVDMVLELNSGEAEKIRLKKGDNIIFFTDKNKRRLTK